MDELTRLGSGKTVYQFNEPDPTLLETFPNPQRGRDYNITHETKEFTSLCPKTGQPDFAVITIEMVPDTKCIESKSLKLYLMSYRNHGAFMEATINQILNDLIDVCSPHRCEVTGGFGARGGITTTVKAIWDNRCQNS